MAGGRLHCGGSVKYELLPDDKCQSSGGIKVAVGGGPQKCVMLSASLKKRGLVDDAVDKDQGRNKMKIGLWYLASAAAALGTCLMFISGYKCTDLAECPVRRAAYKTSFHRGPSWKSSLFSKLLLNTAR